MPRSCTRHSVLSAGVHAGDVVDASTTSSGCELLAVISVAQRDATLELDGMANSKIEELSLPYEVS